MNFRRQLPLQRLVLLEPEPYPMNYADWEKQRTCNQKSPRGVSKTIKNMIKPSCQRYQSNQPPQDYSPISCSAPVALIFYCQLYIFLWHQAHRCRFLIFNSYRFTQLKYRQSGSTFSNFPSLEQPQNSVLDNALIPKESSPSPSDLTLMVHFPLLQRDTESYCVFIANRCPSFLTSVIVFVEQKDMPKLQQSGPVMGPVAIYSPNAR